MVLITFLFSLDIDAMAIFPHIEWYKTFTSDGEERILVLAWLCFGVKVNFVNTRTGK